MTAPWSILLLAASPDADEARRLAEQELSKPEYLAAQPNAFDRAALAVQKALLDLLSNGDSTGSTLTIAIVLALLVTVLLVVGIILWGRPRAVRRRQHSLALLGEHDRLSAEELRRAAAASARNGDWTAAMTQRYRALARGLIERELLDPAPGATAQAIAGDAATTFPAERPELLAAAALFDGVRYLGASGDEHGYLVIRALDERLAAARIAVTA